MNGPQDFDAAMGYAGYGTPGPLVPPADPPALGPADVDDCCYRCEVPVALPPAADPAWFAPGANGVLRFAGGVVIAPGPTTLCAACAPHTQICRGCGCTDDCACEGPCYWVEWDLCSACRDGKEARADAGS